MLVFALALLASELGLDLLLGGFAAGHDHAPGAQGARGAGLRLQAHRRRVRRLRPVLLRRQRHAARRRRAVLERRRRVARCCCSSCCSSSCAARRRCCSTATCSTARERVALALFTSTQLPLVLAITTVARETGHMRASTAASLVGAAVLSTLVFPMLGLRLRRRAALARGTRGRSGTVRRRAMTPTDGPVIHAPGHSERTRSSRLVRVRVRLTSALWVPVLCADALRHRAGARASGARRAPRRRARADRRLRRAADTSARSPPA